MAGSPAEFELKDAPDINSDELLIVSNCYTYPPVLTALSISFLFAFIVLEYVLKRCCDDPCFHHGTFMVLSEKWGDAKKSLGHRYMCWCFFVRIPRYLWFWGTPIWWNTHITPIPLILIWFPLVTAEKTIRFIHSTRYWERTMSYYSNSMGHDMGDHFWPPTNFSYHASREITRGPPANSTFPSANKEQLRPQPWCELGLQPAGRGNAWLLSFLQVLLTHKKWQAIREANIQNKNRNTAWFLLLPRIHNPPTLS